MNFLKQLFRFGCVGVGAMLVHLTLVTILVPAGLPPLMANVFGFALGFQVSYFGHRGWTFRESGSNGSYYKMLAVSLIAFSLNEIMYAFLLKFTSFDYRVSLIIVLITVAVFTFIASRAWVFRSAS